MLVTQVSEMKKTVSQRENDREVVDASITLKAPITTAADDIHKYFLIVFQRK